MALLTDSLLWDGAIISLLIIPYVMWWIEMKSRQFERTGLPTVGKFKLFWSNIKLITARITFMDFADELYHSIPDAKAFGYMQLLSSAVMVRDPETIDKMLKKDFSNFHDHGVKFNAEVNPLERHLFNLNGAEWKALRNKLSPTFTSGKLKWMLSQIIDCSDTLVQVLAKEHKPTDDVPIREFLSRFAIDVIGSCAFGIDSGALKDPNCEFRRMSKKIFQPSVTMVMKNMLRMFAPGIYNSLKIKSFPEDVSNFFFSLTKQGFEHRLRTGEKRNDFLELLLQLREKGFVDVDDKDISEETIEETTAKLVFTDELLTAQTFIFLVAGWENTAGAIAFVAYFLGKNKEIQSKAREEVKETLEKYENAFTYEALKDMVYLDACVSESLRIFSPGGLLLRKCNKDYPIDGSGYIEADSIVFIPTQAIQRDPAFFEDPMEYKPERFLKKDFPRPPLYMPFGDGPRVCIAQRFALLEIKLAMAKLLHNFEIEVSPKVIEPIELNPKSFSNDIKGGMWVRLKQIK